MSIVGVIDVIFLACQVFPGIVGSKTVPFSGTLRQNEWDGIYVHNARNKD